MPDFLHAQGLSKRFGANTVVRDVSFGFARGEFVSLLGPSGCGKTTILRMIAGFEQPSEGRILIEDQDITSLPPNQRRLGLVFQAYALFPNMTVAQNIAFGLTIGGVAAAAKRARVEEMLELIGLSGYGQRYPYELSGGQQQRVALARAIAPRPRLLLLDEPLSALDAKIRVSLRQEIRAIQQNLGITTVFVTHDQEEALSISDRVAVMNAGRIEQLGTPTEIYNTPQTPFVANFVGTLSTLSGEVLDAGQGRVRIEGQEVCIANLPVGVSTGQVLSLALRPESISLTPREPDVQRLRGQVTDASFLGPVIRLELELGGSRLKLDSFNDPRAAVPRRGELVDVHFSPRDVMVLGVATPSSR